MEKKNKDILKLIKLLKHWADHNESHKDSFLKWQKIAQSNGLFNIAENLKSAIEMMDKCTGFLLTAHKKLEQSE